MSIDIKEINDAYFNACNFESLMRGIHFAVYVTALSKIFTGPRTTGIAQSRRTLAILVSLFFLMSTMHHATYWAYVRRAFIAKGQTAQSIAAALNEYPSWTGVAAVADLNAILADAVIIWRAWIIWGRLWRIIILPTICTILTLVFSIIATYQTVTSTKFGQLKVDYATALYSTSLITTAYCTIVIVHRIIYVSKRSFSGPGLGSYRGVIEILVESSALYFIATLFALVAYIVNAPASEYATAFWTSVTGIAPTLIVARVAGGEARPNETWNEGGEPQLSTRLQFRTRSVFDSSESSTAPESGELNATKTLEVH